MRRLAVAVAVVAAAVGVGAELVQADAPVKQGWWSRRQQTSPSTLPGGIPVTVPAPPTADDGGLTVAHGPDGPEAVAAMYFVVEAPVDGTLYLRAAPKKKEGTPGPTTPTSTVVEPDGIVLPQGATVLVCKALSAWEREANAPWNRAPTWDTVDCAAGTLTADKTAMFWPVTTALQDDEENYDLVLVPTAPTVPTPYMVNFGSPGPDTLAVDTFEDDPPPDEPPPPDDPPDEDPVPSVDEGTGITAPPTGGFSTPTTVVRTPPTSLVASRPPGRRVPFSFPDTRAERMMAVSLLLAMAGALWWVGGSPARMPRLIGAVAGRAPSVAPLPPSLRGVGRFARPRDGRVPRL